MYENGSARDSYGAFTDDEPTAGAVEAKRKAELAKKQKESLKFNNVNLLLSMSGIKATSVQAPTMNGSIMGSAGLSQRNNSGKSYIVPATKGAIEIHEQDWQINARNFHEVPGKYKFGFLCNYLYDRTFGLLAENLTNFALIDGMQPEYAKLYGDFSSGMAFESFATISITGLKSARNLSKGITSERDIIVGSGFGNVPKGVSKAETDIPSAFKQKEFASSYESRINQTPADVNIKAVFEVGRGESLCTLKPPPDTELKKRLVKNNLTWHELNDTKTIQLVPTKINSTFGHLGDDDGKFEDGQYEAYQVLINCWNGIQETLLKFILDYYKEKRKELGYDIEFNEHYPEIKSTKELLNYITLVGIKVPYANIYGGRSIGISFDCTWDEENGVGLRLNDEQVVEVGYQDIAI